MFIRSFRRSIPAFRHIRLLPHPISLRTYASITETAPASSAPHASVTKFVDLTKVSLAELQKKLSGKQFEYPYNSLNELSPLSSQDLFEDFQTVILDKNQAYLEKKELRAEQLGRLTIADYFRPRIDLSSPLLYLVFLNRYPDDLAESKGYKSKTDIMTGILTSLLHLHHSGRVLRALPESKRADINWDIGNPAEWFPHARRMRRKIIMHVGPTNSGKTYNSLQAFATAKSGYYAGPLRLLAREVYERFQSKNVSCNLITGEEVIPSLDEYGNVTNLSSGTIEMIPLHKKMDVCIIDEIQMIADAKRGSVWTSAVLGVQAKEVHLCGEESAVPLIQELVKSTGDEIEIHKYDRLGKLTVLDQPVLRFENLKPGDCVVVFTKLQILELKCEIEKKTKYKVGVIYGGLPPEIRSSEAQRFNSGEYDILVASDAIGMGLNLKINRVVFYTTKKFNGQENAVLSVSATKQIAGRAGRYDPEKGKLEGFVTAFRRGDLRFIQKTMRTPIADIEKACIWPPSEFWIHYMSSFRSPVSYTTAVEQFELEVLKTSMDHYFLSDFQHQMEILNLLIKNNLHKTITFEDQLRLALVPFNISRVSPKVIAIFVRILDCILRGESKTVFDFGFLHTKALLSEPSYAKTSDQILSVMFNLEMDHRLVLAFMWLSQRWPTLFIDKESALEIKTLIEKRMREELNCLRQAAQREKLGRMVRRRNR